ncbi:MAG: UDP-N-acetylmuramoyl-tripeptide--D-alanyl-D-alanine ligase [Actinomycetota bacterium]|nr:UDP-N-acetylmuramoyl-tripeptide--D-alanyl-D-alanine ligase [Actinomycetota bacterium]
MARRYAFNGRRYLLGEAPVRDVLLYVGVEVARAHRRRLVNTAFVGVTGSAGKTTTKELTAAVLGTQLTGTWNPDNQNGLKNLGRTILHTRSRHDYCVLEVAAWYPGSVARVARLVQPTIAVVTRIGLDHYKAFRSREAIALEKRALVEALPDEGCAVLNADDPHVIAMAEGFQGRVVSFGESPSATLRASDITSVWPEPLAFRLHHEGREWPVRTRLHGKHVATTVLAAMGVAVALDVPIERALEAVATFEPVPGRMSPVQHRGATFMRDDAKASLWSFPPVLEFLSDAQAERKLLVVGTLSDYPGPASRRYRILAEEALTIVEKVVFVGPNSRHVLRARGDFAGRLYSFETLAEARDYLEREVRAGDLILVKGSRHADKLVRLVPGAS